MEEYEFYESYNERIASRGIAHFVVGLFPRLWYWGKFAWAKRKAMKSGAKIGKNTMIHPRLAKQANANLVIGDESSIEAEELRLRSPIHIGNHVIISRHSRILTTSHNIDSPEWEFKYYGITIEDYVWIASSALILPSCRRIGYGAVIGAGAVVAKDVPPMSVMGGNPACCIKQRKQVHDRLVIPSLLSGDLPMYWKAWMNRRKRK